MNTAALTQERLKEVLHYCPDLGLFWWKERADGGKRTNSWNARWAGQLAGSRSTHGYGKVKIDGVVHFLHRLAWLYMTGEHPREDIDHKNLRKTDNAFSNLREANRSQNNTNKRCASVSGLKGAFLRPNGRYQASISVNDKAVHLGTYDTPEQAHAAYLAKAREYHGDFARAA